MIKLKTSQIADGSNPFLFVIGLAVIPLVSIAFHLMMMYIMAADLSFYTPLERIYLPYADEATIDAFPPKDRLVINIRHYCPQDKECLELEYKDSVLFRACVDESHWREVWIKGKEVKTADLAQRLTVEGDIDREHSGVSNRPVMIYADASTPYETIRKTLDACKQAKIRKIEFGTITAIKRQ
jgi:biopolymer transport protein ExbD